ncbi:hypothetical protein, partial [Pseudomonas putida]|uniref:hypothetical protein n=1 Tax=Pseudomonas putida TaxID=303 RepID=UPI001E621F00
APERNREHSIGNQVDGWNVGMMDPLRKISSASFLYRWMTKAGAPASVMEACAGSEGQMRL